MKQILVLGSLNIDLVERVPRLPQPGETLRGEDLQIFVGGKGANQACAAALLGGQVAMAGMVGKDVFGPRLIQELRGAGVNTDLVEASESASGSATILVLPSGENVIVISPAANGKVSVEFALSAVEKLHIGDFLLCQLEIPMEAVHAALHAAHARGVITILDPAPASNLPGDLLRSVSILTPNQTEAAFLLDRTTPPETMAEAQVAAQELRALGAETVIIKLGAAGCFVKNGETAQPIPGFQVPVIDTTAAGDTFNGALAASLADGSALMNALTFANAAAALSVTKAGAISSIPSRQEVVHFLRSSGSTH